MGKRKCHGKRFLRKNRNGRNQKARHAHFIKRARKHYRLDIKENDINKFIELIENGKARFIEIQIAMWEVALGDDKLPVIYDHRAKRLVTCLPQAALERALERKKERNCK